MRFLEPERSAFATFLPGLDEELVAIPLEELESPQSRAIELFREAGGAGLLVPREHGGLGADPVQAIRVQRAIGSRAPSLAVAVTMHHFSIAGLLETDDQAGLESVLLQAIAEGGRLIASGFAEGMSGQGVFAPTMRAERRDGRLVISGAKKPCSLSRAMDLLTASVLVEDRTGGEPQLGVAIIPADSPGLEVEPFWRAPVLTGAQSDAVILNDVILDPDAIVPLGTEADGRLDRVQQAGFIWFAMLMSASYLGMASAIVERLLAKEGGEPLAKLFPVTELEGTMASLEGLARAKMAGDEPEEMLSRAIACRYAAQDAINRAVVSAFEQLGGQAFITSYEVSYFAAASRALAFHPPSRSRTAERLIESFKDVELAIA